MIKKYDTVKSPHRLTETESSDVSDAEKDNMSRRKDSLDLQQLPEKTQ